MFPSHDATRVSVSGLTNTLCGAPEFRGPSHFIGVATVVAKLFNLVRPTRAYFGCKDFQQVRVIEQMNQDLELGVHVVRCPTVREADGLALSSRNAYLSSQGRTIAPQLYQSLQYGRKLLTSHSKMRPNELCRKVKTSLASVRKFKIDYIELVDPKTLERLNFPHRPALLAACVWLGQTRLIDNILIR
jgi:pantoate--beta-alanine ligase